MLELPPLREQLIESPRLKTVPTQHMVPQFAALLNDTDSQRPLILRGELLDLDGSAEPCNAASHDQDIVLHDLALDGLGGAAEEA